MINIIIQFFRRLLCDHKWRIVFPLPSGGVAYGTQFKQCRKCKKVIEEFGTHYGLPVKESE